MDYQKEKKLRSYGGFSKLRSKKVNVKYLVKEVAVYGFLSCRIFLGCILENQVKQKSLQSGTLRRHMICI
jgi:hypothetical protein